MNDIRIPFHLPQTRRASLSASSPRPPLRRASHLLSLEQRFMFDGAAIATAADAAQHNAAQDAAHAAEAAAAHLVRAADPAADGGKKEVVFVDTSLANYQVLEAGVRAGVAIVEFNGAADGLAQIAQWARNNTGYDAIHILSHGSEGKLDLGTMVLDEAALASDTVKAELADIGRALNAGGDLLLYGCDVAAGSDGQLFINDIARLTGADVAASTDATGAAGLGGDWVLESHTGSIEARTLQIDGYDGLMGVVNFSAGNIPGNTQSVATLVDGYNFTFSAQAGSTIAYNVINGKGGIYSRSSSIADGGPITISAPSGYTFDFTFLNWSSSSSSSPVATISVTYSDGSTRTASVSLVTGTTINVPFSTYTITKLEISAGTNINFRDFTLTNIKQIPVVTDNNISIISTGTGIGGAYKIGDTVTARWNNTSSGDNSSGIVAMAFDFSQFGATSYVYGTNANGIWTASYTITSGNIDAVNRNVSALASNGSVVTRGADSTNLTVDNIAPTITAGRISITGASGAGGVYKIGDVVTVTWNNTAAGDNNSDTISGVKVDFSQFGGSIVTATNAGGIWSASYMVTAGTIDALNRSASVTVMDDAGNTTARASAGVQVDNIVPTVVITSSASRLAAGETATITFNFSEDPGSSFTLGDVTVIGGTLSALSGSGLMRTAVFTPTANTNSGTATITVTAGSFTDAAGNSSGGAASLSLTYDTQAPNAPSTPVMSSASDTGVSNSDAITRNTTPTFTGTAEAGAKVILYDTNGTTVLGTTTADGSGNWSITTSALSQGTHVLQAMAVDAAGNASPRSAGLVVVIDTTPPTVTITSNVAALKIGETATITFTFSEDPGSGFSLGSVTVSGGTLSGLAGTGLTRTAIFTPTAGTNNGTASITVAAGSYTDVAGNTGTAGSTPTLRFDTLAPNAPSAPVLTAASDTGTSSSDNITRNTTPTFTGTAEAGATVTLYDTDGTTVLGTAVATGGNWSITVSALAEGSHTITARAVDAAGNRSSRSTGLAVTIDTTPPTVVITSNVATLKGGETAIITFTFSEDPGSTFTTGDVVVSGGTLSAITGSGLTRTAIFTPTANINSGTASITVTAGSYTDAAGNSGGAGTTPTLTFDTLAPNAPSAPVMAGASDTGVSSSDAITSNTTPTFTGTAEAGATVTLYDSNGVTVLGSGTADGSGHWSITVSALSEGTHEIDASATDSAGNTSSRSATLVVVIDTTAPTVTITSNAASLKSGETATITFTFNEDPGSTFTAGDVVVSGGTLSAITGSGLTRTAVFTPTANTNGGTASITVTVGSYTDVAGNAGGAGTTPTLTFDTLAPNAPSAPVMAAASDTGTSNSDNITRNTTPTFTGTAEAGATVTLYDTNGTTVLGTAVADGSGNWSITTSALTEGAHTITARATDAAGNVGARSSGLAVTIDTTAPTVTVTSDVATLKSGETATITFTFSEDPGSTFGAGSVSVSGGTLSAITGSGLTRTATFTPTAHVSGGAASITVTAGSYTDTAGNNGGAGATPALAFNTLVPDAPSAPAMTAASDTGTSSSDGITSNTTPTFTGTATAGVTVTLYDTNGTTVLGTAVADGSGNWSITTSALAEGSHTLHATATDGSGNVSGLSAGAVVRIDTTAPTVTVTSDVATLKSGETATITFTFSEDPGSTFTAGDVVVSGGTLSAITGSGLTRTAVFTPTAHVGGGTASITVTAGSYTDTAGNNGGAGATPTLTFNTLVPDAPSAPAMTAASDTGTSNSDGITSNTTPTFTGTATAGVTVTLYDTNGTTVLGTAVADGSGNWSITASTLAEGSHTLHATATDGSGNVSGLSAGAVVRIDTTAPTMVITSNVASLKIGETATITFTFSEDPGSTFTAGDVVVSGGTLSAISGSGLTRTATFTPTANTNGGTASITVAAGSYTDAAGNNGGAGSAPALSFDTLAPNAPSAPVMTAASDTGTSNSDNITRNTTPTFTGTAEAGSTVTLYDTDGTTVLGTAVATGGNWSITVSTLGEGGHTITARATDAAGNIGTRSTGLNVTIDTTPPTVSISSNIANLATGTAATITFTFSEDPGSTFTAGDLVVSGGTLSSITGSGLTRTAVFTPTANTNNGTATITVTAGSFTDAAGNSSGGAASLSLSYDTLAPNAPSAPVMTAASDTGTSNSDNITRNTTPTFTGTAEAGATVILYDTNGTTVLGTAVANGSGNWSITTSALAEGAHVLQAMAVDSAGNASPRSSGLVVVIDTTPPTVTITSNAAALKIGETATITFTFSEDPGSAFSLGSVTVSGGTLSGLTGSGLTRTAIFTPTANTNGGTASITVAAGSYSDTAGNSGGAGTTPTLNFDTLAPNAPSVPVMTAASDTGTSNSDNITRNTTPTFTGTAEAGSTVTLYDTDRTTVLGTATADGAGNWSITTSILSEGAHTITARTVDAAGNRSSRSAGLDVTIDTTPPTVVITSNVGSLKGGETAIITFTFSEDPGSTFTAGDVAVSGGTLSAITGSGLTRTAIFTPTANTNSGTASITVTAGSYTDAAGNNGGAGTTPTLVFDTLAPNAPSTPVMSSASDTGLSNSDNVTRITTPTFTGTAEAGATVTLYDSNGLTVVGTGVADAGGHWSITVSALTDGVHEIDAAATDSAGNTGSRSTALSVTIITTPPTQVLDGLYFSGSIGQSGNVLLTSSVAQTIVGTLSAPLDVNQFVEVSLDNGNTWRRADAIIDNAVWMIDGMLDPSGSTLKIRVADIAGNIGETWSQVYEVDTTAPTVASVSVPANGTYSLGQNLDFVVHFSEAVVVHTDGGIPSIALTLDTGGTVQATYVSGSETGDLIFRYTVANNVQDLTGVTVGALTLNGGQLTDIAGNDAVLALNAVGSTAAVNVDGLDPHVVNVNIANGSGAYGAGSVITIVITYDRPVAVDTFGGTPSFALNSGGVATYASGAGTATLVFTYTVAAGQNAAGLDLGGTMLLNGGTVVDVLGLQTNALPTLGAALSSHPEIVIDTIPPATPAIDRIDTSGLQPVLSGTATIASGERLTVTLGGATYNVAVVNGAWSLDLASAIPASGSLSLVPGGSSTAIATVTDLAGNSSSASATLLVSSVPPSVLSPALNRAPAFVSPQIPLFMSRPPVWSVNTESAPRLAVAPLALSEWSPDQFIQDESPLVEREGRSRSADARLADPTAESRLTLGGGFAVMVIAQHGIENRPVVNQGIGDLTLASTSYTEFFVPKDAFAHGNQRAAVYLTATRPDGKPLPYWVSFNPATGKFVIDAKACLSANVSVKVVAHDGNGKSASTQFHIRIGEQGAGAQAGDGGNTSGMSLEHAGCIALSDQIQLAAQAHRDGVGELLAGLAATLSWQEA